MDSRAFYAAARERLVGATDDAAMIAALDRLIETSAQGDDDRTEEALDAFLGGAFRLGLSLDYIFAGKGQPHVEWTA